MDSLLAGDYRTFRDAVSHLILPGLVLASSVMGLVTRVTRASMLDVLGAGLRADGPGQGLREEATIARHALRNALIPTVTVLGLAYGGLLSGAVMTETIFAWPELGRYAFQSAVTNDFPAIMGVTFVIGLMYTMVNFAVDLLSTAGSTRRSGTANGDGVGNGRGGGLRTELWAPRPWRCRGARAAGSSCS